MTYAAAIDFLEQLQLFGARFGLGKTRKLAGLFGNPQERLQFIHVAGTNGKGSTCAMLESIYRRAGYRVGLFISPHLVRFGERIQVNRRPIGDKDVAELAGELRAVLENFPDNTRPTFFEAVTVMALCHFARRRCDLVVWETGLGGRLDATNIVTPLASLITNVELDHEKWLGSTRAKIAAEKAGIIKPRVPVLTAETSAGPLKILRAKARAVKAPFTRVTGRELDEIANGFLALPLAGAHQRRNAALAVATVRQLSSRLPVRRVDILAGLRSVSWPGRFQIFRSGARQEGTLVFDGAHNPAAARALRQALEDHFPGSDLTLVLAIFRDKNWPEICRILAPLASRILVTSVHSPRAVPPDALAASCAEANSRARVRVCASPLEAMRLVSPEELTVVAGSLYLVGEILPLLERGGGGRVSNETRLNDWTTGTDH